MRLTEELVLEAVQSGSVSRVGSLQKTDGSVERKTVSMKGFTSISCR